MPDTVTTVQDGKADRVMISGASDDLIYVEGAVEEEFHPGLEVEDEGVYVALSCGALFRVRYDGDWSVRLYRSTDEPVIGLQHEMAHDHDLEGVREYSDAMIVQADSIDWALIGGHAVLSDA